MTVKVGVIGTGGIGQGHIERIMTKVPGATVTAVNDINMDICRQVAETHGAKAFEDPHALIGSADVDAVLVCSWDPTHEEFVVASINAGKPVLCEKPLSDTSDGCRRVMEAEIASGKHLVMVGFMRRYDAGYRELHDAIASGSLGRPLVLHCKHRNMHPVGAKHTTDMSVSGSMVHEFDVIRYLIGDDDPYISAQLVAPRPSKYADEDLLDPQLVYLETKNGIRINIESFVNCHYGYDVQCEVVCDEGTATLPDPPRIIRRQGGVNGYAIQPHWNDRFPEAYEIELREWIDCVSKGIPPMGPTAWDGYVTAATAEACIQSRKTKQIVPINLGERPAFYNK